MGNAELDKAIERYMVEHGLTWRNQGTHDPIGAIRQAMRWAYYLGTQQPWTERVPLKIICDKAGCPSLAQQVVHFEDIATHVEGFGNVKARPWFLCNKHAQQAKSVLHI